MLCSKCKDLPENLRCTQKKFIERKPLERKYFGCGVSLAPSDKVEAIPLRSEFSYKYFVQKNLQFRSKAQSAKSFEMKPIIHPDELGLKPIICEDQIIENCGSMIFKIYDKQEPTVMAS